ncbi:Glu-tRNA(Gln) amidotransferase subunit GatD, partial [Candidatus Aenigmatarchaeota archaeon]
AKRIAEEIEAGVDGVIVTHGTDTMHYTSAALSFMLRDLPVPVMLVGSQRSSDRGSSDSTMNLICAARFIEKSDFAGVAICMHGSSSDEFCFIHDNTNVRKMHTSRRDAFRSIDVTPFGKIHADGEIEWLRKDYVKKEITRQINLDAVFDKKIALIKAYPGFDHTELEFYEKQNYKGLVIESMALGHLPNRATDQYTKHHEKMNTIIEKMTKKGMIIVLASQCPYGRVNLNVYSPQRRLLDAGVIPVRMTSETAFVKLGWALGQTKEPEKVKEIMMTNFVGEIVERIDPDAFLY